MVGWDDIKLVGHDPERRDKGVYFYVNRSSPTAGNARGPDVAQRHFQFFHHGPYYTW